MGVAAPDGMDKQTTDTGKTKKATTPETLREQWKELLTLRDELRVRAHLLGMDAKDALHDLEPKIDRLERELDKAAGDAAGRLAKTLERTAASLRKIAAQSGGDSKP